MYGSDVLGYVGRRVVVTGAASGIGRATAELLVSLGAEVHAVDLAEVSVDGVASAHEVDLGSPPSIESYVDTIDGRLDGLFSCAGVPGTFPALAILDINFGGTRLLAERIIPVLSPGSAVCFVGSTAGFAWLQNFSLVRDLVETPDFARAHAWCEEHLHELGWPYDFSKQAVNAYTSIRGVSLGPAGLRTVCVNPSATRTPASKDFIKAVKAKPGGLELLKDYPMPMGRPAEPHEQAWIQVLLSSPRAGYVNGANINVDGGLIGGVVTGCFAPSVAEVMRWQPVAGALRPSPL